jgi:hypothetical protein
MTTRSAIVPSSIAATIGIALWLATAALTGRREAWDASAYWTVAYPVALGACALLGYLYPSRAWLWAIVLFEAQFLAMCIRNGEIGNLWPLGLMLFAVLALPGVLVAQLTSRRARQADPPST